MATVISAALQGMRRQGVHRQPELVQSGYFNLCGRRLSYDDAATLLKTAVHTLSLMTHWAQRTRTAVVLHRFGTLTVRLELEAVVGLDEADALSAEVGLILLKLRG